MARSQSAVEENAASQRSCRGVTRRVLLAAAAGVPAAGAAGRIRLGTKVFSKSADPVLLAREHRGQGYSAAFCPEIDPNDRERVAALGKAFAAQDVVLAEVGAWRNLLEPDAAKRKANLAFVMERLDLAECVGALSCVDCAGSFADSSHSKMMFGPHPMNLSQEFFDATVENCRRIIDGVKPKRAKFTIEMMGWTLPDGPDSYLQLLKAVDRREFGVHMDPFNVITSPRLFYRNGDLIRDCFRKLGRWIVSCHAKDLELAPEQAVRFRVVTPGQGGFDYRAYLSEISGLSMETPLLMEHLPTRESYDEGKKYIWQIGAEIGVKFV